MEKIENARVGQRNVLIKIKEQNEELYSLIAVEPLHIEDVRQLLDPNTTLFSYYVADKVLYIWAVNKDRVHLERIKINKEDVSGLVASFNAAIISRDKKLTAILSEKIYDTFLKPVIPFVAGDRVGFIPHGPLNYLSYAAMSYKGQYLINGFSIFYLTDAGLLKYVMKKQPSCGNEAFGFW